MSTGITGRQLLNNSVIDNQTLIIELPATAVVGAAEDLFARIQAVVEVLPINRPTSQPTAITISNNSINPAYLRGRAIGLGAAFTGQGILIQPNGSIFLPIASYPNNFMGLENLSPVAIMVTY